MRPANSISVSFTNRSNLGIMPMKRGKEKGSEQRAMNRSTQGCGWLEKYARPLGQTVSVRQRDLANTHGVCGSVALIQIGILGEDFLLCRHPIDWLVEIQFLAVGNVSRSDIAPRR